MRPILNTEVDKESENLTKKEKSQKMKEKREEFKK